MAVTNTDAVANAQLDGLDSTFNSGKLRIWTGSPPAVGVAPTGTLLLDEDLPADAFAAASARSKAKAGTWQATGAAAGNAGYFRLISSTDGGGTSQTDPRIQGTVTATGGGGDMELDNISIAVGQQVTITTFALTLP